MSILFINGSPDHKGSTASLAATLLEGRDYETIQLPEHRIYPYGSTLEGDEFDWVLDRMKAADTIVIGSPVYWHNIVFLVCPLMCLPNLIVLDFILKARYGTNVPTGLLCFAGSDPVTIGIRYTRCLEEQA